METPRYHRDQAEECLKLAQLMIDPHAARILRSAAGRHFEQASELEKLTASGPRPACFERDEARRMAVNFARLPELLGKAG